MEINTSNPRVRGLHLTGEQIEALVPFAQYNWYKDTEQTIWRPDLLIALVMDIGSYEDICRLIEIVGLKRLRYVLRTAEAGEFEPFSWTYWHYRLMDTEPGCVPPLPKRKIP